MMVRRILLLAGLALSFSSATVPMNGHLFTEALGDEQAVPDRALATAGAGVSQTARPQQSRTGIDAFVAVDSEAEDTQRATARALARAVAFEKAEDREAAREGQQISPETLVREVEKADKKVAQDQQALLNQPLGITEVVLHAMHRHVPKVGPTVVSALSENEGLIFHAAKSFINFDIRRYLPNRAPKDKLYRECMSKIESAQDIGDDDELIEEDSREEDDGDNDESADEEGSNAFIRSGSEDEGRDSDDDVLDSDVLDADVDVLDADDDVFDDENDVLDADDDEEEQDAEDSSKPGKLLDADVRSQRRFVRPFRIISSPALFAIAETVAEVCLLRSKERTLVALEARIHDRIKGLFRKVNNSPASTEKNLATTQIKQLRDKLVPILKKRQQIKQREKLLNEMVEGLNWAARLREAKAYSRTIATAQFKAAKELRSKINPDGSAIYPKNSADRAKYILRLEKSFDNQIKELSEDTVSRKLKYFMAAFMDAGPGVVPNYHLASRRRYNGLVIGAGVGAGANEKLGKGSHYGDLAYNPEANTDVFPTDDPDGKFKPGTNALDKPLYKPPPGTITPETRN